jgi:hypothetical protein
MAIAKDEVIALMKAFHDVVMYDKGTAERQARFFPHPEPRIFIPHGEDISLETNYEIHRNLTDEKHVVSEQWDITPLCDKPERARVVGEGWIVQRVESGALKIALYINSFHHFLPDSAPIALK